VLKILKNLLKVRVRKFGVKKFRVKTFRVKKFCVKNFAIVYRSTSWSKRVNFQLFPIPQVFQTKLISPMEEKIKIVKRETILVFMINFLEAIWHFTLVLGPESYFG